MSEEEICCPNCGGELCEHGICTGMICPQCHDDEALFEDNFDNTMEAEFDD